MAEDDLQSKQFIREVDEEFRRAQIKAIWERFSPIIIGVCVLVVVATGGYRGWIWWQARQAAQAGDVYMTAADQLGTGASAEGEATLNKLAAEGGGYGVLARMRLAGARIAAGDKPGALAQYDAISNDARVSEVLRDLARLRAGLLALDAGDLAGAKSRVESLAVPGNGWRHAAREVLGTAAFASGDLAAATSNFQAIQADAEAPRDLRSRAELMMRLIEAQGTEAPAGATPAGSSPTPAAATHPADGAAQEPASDFAEPATIPNLVPSDDQATSPDASDGGLLAPSTETLPDAIAVPETETPQPATSDSGTTTAPAAADTPAAPADSAAPAPAATDAAGTNTAPAADSTAPATIPTPAPATAPASGESAAPAAAVPTPVRAEQPAAPAETVPGAPAASGSDATSQTPAQQ